MKYDISEVFSDYFRKRTLSGDELTELVGTAKEFVDWVKPDFFLVGGPTVPGLVSHEENIRLDFGDKTPSSLTLINNIVEEQVHILQEVDALTLKYAMMNPMEPREFIFSLQFNVSFTPNEIRTIERKIIILQVNEKNNPDLAILSLTDVTHMNPEQKIGFEVRTNCHVDRESEVEWVKELTGKVEKVINPAKLTLTSREMQILKEIEQGLSSSKIAEKLFISKATVDTHRQNMIKKFGVPNTTSLIYCAKQQGIL